MTDERRKLLEKPRWIQNAVSKIVWDLSDRRGIGNEWEQIDDDIKDEISFKWAEAIEACLPSPAQEAGLLQEVKQTLITLEAIAPGYDWNADPQKVTLMLGELHAKLDAALRSTSGTKETE